MIDLFSLGKIRRESLEFLVELAQGQKSCREFWAAMQDACQREIAELTKPQRESEITLELPEMQNRQRGIAREKIALVIHSANNTQDDHLILFLAAIAVAFTDKTQIAPVATGRSSCGDPEYMADVVSSLPSRRAGQRDLRPADQLTNLV